MYPYIILAVATIANLLIRPVIASEISSQTLFELTNRARIEHGLVPLSYSETLQQAALAKAKDMVDGGYFDHFGPIGQTPWQFMEATGYRYDYGGENLAVGFTTAQEVVRAWLNSPTHRDNLLETHFEDIGIGMIPAVVDGLPDLIVVEMFGSLLQPDHDKELTNYVNELLGVSDVITH